ncbi:DUF373 family protein [Acidianus sulfidivorans JP7]|uniref:DUF373 domain-containing protein n=1 Tax=Acidianus sulfidivorans JP7 TaxID=619593 RepID=A0A2U9IP70_9CREN|nr:DUF373 family protein [Acidianus sulfidivorans]AWR97803.1 DUF373 family protein [Acidianus sulfidivorans JP7]
MVKTAIIYIDIDDDLGNVGISSPVIGEENAKLAIDKASESLAEDSDFNSMVVAFNTFRQLKKQNKDVEIVFIAGSSKGGLEAQRRLAEELEEVIQKLRPEDAIIVYDSPEDAKALPILQSRIKISGIQRVIVEQHKGVEETYVLLGKYIKKVFNESRYSRLFLGVPGIILFITSLLAILGLSAYVIPAILLILGIAMVFKGFSIDDIIEHWWENSTIMFIVAILSVISFIISIINGYITFQAIKGSPLYVFSNVTLAMLPYLAFSGIILFSGKAISKAIDKNVKLLNDVIKIVAIILSYYIIAYTLKDIEEGIYLIQFQSIYYLIISSMILIFVYIVLNIFEKYRLTSK